MKKLRYEQMLHEYTALPGLSAADIATGVCLMAEDPERSKTDRIKEIMKLAYSIGYTDAIKGGLNQ